MDHTHRDDVVRRHPATEVTVQRSTLATPPAPAAPLARFPVVGTHSLEEARDAVTRIYLPHDLVAAHDEVDVTLNAVSDHHLTLGYLTTRRPPS
jgi:hypothetical protein